MLDSKGYVQLHLAEMSLLMWFSKGMQSRTFLQACLVICLVVLVAEGEMHDTMVREIYDWFARCDIRRGKKKRSTPMVLNMLKILDKNHDCEILFPQTMYSRSYW